MNPLVPIISAILIVFSLVILAQRNSISAHINPPMPYSYPIFGDK